MITKINDIDTTTEEGKLLLAAMSKLAAESRVYTTKAVLLQQLREIADKMFKEENK